ncbi:MAG: ABC transporter substrate-binding protein [Rhodobacteraceae bacterium]|jgi:iron complex transport system substrate-binding protein|nr:ABC transporter substrate-binding protein [Paracoccaceae bacterium]
MRPATAIPAAGLALALSLALSTMVAAAEGEAQRIISLGGSVTEIAVALGAGDRLVARDTTSNHPPDVLALPDVGYLRALSPEGVLSLDPDLILAETGAGPAEAVDVLKAAGIPFVSIPGSPTPAGIAEKIRAVGAALGAGDRAEALAATVEAGLRAAEARAAEVAVPRRVLFVLSVQGGRVMAGGEGSSAEAIIRLAGGTNAATEFTGYGQMADEALLTAAPDVILMMETEGDRMISDAQVLSHPALAETPAAKAGALLRMDGMLLLGFGPRTPEAALQLHGLLYPAGG